MVFIALPALQRNQRDTQRKNDMSRLKTAIDNYKSNNKGQLPTRANFNDFIVSYLKNNGDNFKTPTGGDYEIILRLNYNQNDIGWKSTQVIAKEAGVYLTASMRCDSEVKVIANGPSNYTIQTMLEGCGAYCIDG